MAKTMPYHTTFGKCKHDIKDNWNTIKTIIQKTTTGNKFPTILKLMETL